MCYLKTSKKKSCLFTTQVISIFYNKKKSKKERKKEKKMRGRKVRFDPRLNETGVYGSFNDEEEYSEHDDDDDDAHWDEMMEHEAAGLLFGRRRKKKGQSMMNTEPILDVLSAQGSLIADNVLSVVSPALKSLAASGKRRKEDIEDALRDLIRIKKELSAAREEASHYKTLMEECLERERIRSPNQPTIEQVRDLQNVQDAGDDLGRELDDVEQEANTLGNNLLKAIQEEEHIEENVLEQVSVAMRSSVSQQEERVQSGEPPALPPRDIPELPLRDIPAAPPAPSVPTHGPRFVIQPRSEPLPISRNEATDIQEVTKDTLVNSFNKLWAETNAIMKEEEQTEEERLREEAEQAEWEDTFNSNGSISSMVETIRPSTYPIRARLESMRNMQGRMDRGFSKKKSFRVRSTVLNGDSAKEASRKTFVPMVKKKKSYCEKDKEDEEDQEELFW